MLKANSVIDGRYTLISKLGAGEFGNVWKVLDVEDGKKKAMKMAPRKEKAFLREVKFLKAASHIQGITRFFSSFDFENWGCLVISLEGEPLDLVMSRSEVRGVSVENLRRIMYSLGQTIMEIHAMGFIHRDLHARNILVTASHQKCELKIIDFGVCVEQKNEFGTRNNHEEDDDTVNFAAARHSSLRVIRNNDYVKQDDWISLIYVMIHYNGVQFDNDGMQMIFDKYTFDENPHALLCPDLHWLADCYQLLMESEVNFEAVLSIIAGEEPDFDVKSQIEFEEDNGKIKFM